jgi:hypothetical protein
MIFRIIYEYKPAITSSNTTPYPPLSFWDLFIGNGLAISKILKSRKPTNTVNGDGAMAKKVICIPTNSSITIMEASCPKYPSITSATYIDIGNIIRRAIKCNIHPAGGIKR